jgi:pimeloyl-ACP methyl ester carboxylesterase
MAQQRSTTTTAFPSPGDGDSLLAPARGHETTSAVSGGAAATPTGPLGRVIAASMTAGVVAAAALTFAVLPSAPEATIVGAALIAFAAGWAMLGWLSARLTTRPQRWTYVPAAVMASSGAALIAFAPGEPVMTHLAWVWAPALVVLAVWMPRQTRRNVPGRGRLLIHAVTVAMLLAGLGGLYQVGTTAPGAAARAMPGRLVDVGGYRLHLDCTGAGSPTVVLLNGLAQTSPGWARISPAVAGTTRVCAYDRAGQGWSDDSPHPADAVNAATDLHRLLAAAGESGPYVLAGHSSGGVHALTYAARYPHDVSGMVLLDSSSPHQAELVTTFDAEYQLARRALALAPTLFRFGIGHITQATATATLPGKAAEQAAVFANSPRGMRNMRAEQAALPETFRQAQALTTLGTTPLVVLTAKDNADHRPGWGTAQDRLAALSSGSRHTVADLDHMGLLLDPSGSALSVDAITDVVAAARARSRLHMP